jgi:hypothetical protein
MVIRRESRSAANGSISHGWGPGQGVWFLFVWIEERAAPRRTGPYRFVGARGRVFVCVCLFGLRREPLRGERVHIALLGPGAGCLCVCLFVWIEERAAPRRTGPYRLVGARGRVSVCVCLFVWVFRGCWGLLMPDNCVFTASAAADLFSSHFKIIIKDSF